MMILYNTTVFLSLAGARIVARFNPKVKRWMQGRCRIFERLRQAIPEGERIFWIHCASLGEFEQGRPLIEAVRAERPEYKILLTFFSSSGYEIRKNYPGADYIFYLPADTPRNVRRFLEIVRPEIAVFVKYEFWLNYLRQLGRSSCRTFIISAIFRSDSPFFKWYGGAFRKALACFERIFVQNTDSELLLDSIGISATSIVGDTRFDRVAAIAAAAKPLPVVERFAAGQPLFVAGSTWPPDEEILLELIAAHPDVRFVIAPHEIARNRIESLRNQLPRPSALYTESAPESDFSDTQVLFLDTMGMLSSAYRYARYAYIGGGFGAGIHNILEAAVFGVPLAFGPNHRRFRKALELIALGAAQGISSFAELDAWFTAFESDSASCEQTGSRAARYISDHKGATGKIMKYIFGQQV